MKKCKLGDILQFHRGYDLPIDVMEQGEYPVVGSSGINGYHNRYTTEAPSVSVGRSGNSAGKAFIYYGRTWTHNTALFVEKFMNCNPVYAFYLLKSINLSDYATGSAVPTLNRNHIHDIEIQIPNTIEEQKKIANILKVIDDKIELNEKTIDTLESMAKNLYDYWFVQFEFPDANGRPYKTSGGKMEWNETLSREIPAGWEVQNVGSLIKKQKSIKSIERRNYSANGKYPIVDQSAEYIAGYTNDEVNALEGEESIIVFGDHTRILKYVDFPFAIGADGTQRIVSINKERMPQILFYYSLSRIDLSNYGYARHYKFLKDSVIVVPQKDVASNFEIQVKCWHQIISKIIRENRYLAEMRDFLMPMLMNGQVKILDEREAF